nr:hypothetical protein Iba_chr15dCG0010 [Ipomoea batatas]
MVIEQRHPPKHTATIVPNSSLAGQSSPAVVNGGLRAAAAVSLPLSLSFVDAGSPAYHLRRGSNSTLAASAAPVSSKVERRRCEPSTILPLCCVNSTQPLDTLFPRLLSYLSRLLSVFRRCKQAAAAARELRRVVADPKDGRLIPLLLFDGALEQNSDGEAAVGGNGATTAEHPSPMVSKEDCEVFLDVSHAAAIAESCGGVRQWSPTDPHSPSWHEGGALRRLCYPRQPSPFGRRPRSSVPGLISSLKSLSFDAFEKQQAVRRGMVVDGG